MPQYNIYVSLKNEEILKPSIKIDETMPKLMARIIRDFAEGKIAYVNPKYGDMSATVVNLASLIREGK